MQKNYVELVQSIFCDSKESKIEALRKLIYLSVNDQNKFSHELPKSLAQIEDEQIKLLSLQLLSEMASNFTAKIPAEYYNFPQLVTLLSDNNPEVRKASHYLILMFIKKYEQIDEVIEGYFERISQSPDHWKTLQKIIHSFQSLLIIEPKCVTYSQNYGHFDDFMEMLLNNKNHHHSLVQKASQQTVSSFIKNEYVPEILPKMNPQIMKQLVEYAHKININLQPRRRSPIKQNEPELEQISIAHRKTSVIHQLIEKLDGTSDWKIKSEAIEQISQELSTGTSDVPDELIEKVLDLTYDYNFKTCITAMNVLLTIITLYPNKLYSRHRQIEDVVVDKICDLKLAVRQLANKILRKLYTNHSKDFIKRVLYKLNNCSIVGKEQILTFLQDIFTTNILTELSLVLGEISNQLLNENTRVKIKAIDCLVRISTANELDECKLILSKKLNKVYYEMFLERLKEKMGADRAECWDEKNKLKKGMTWQAERSLPVAENNEKQAMTKVDFGNKKNFNETEEDFTFCNPGFKKRENNLCATSSNSYKTANTFDTFKSQQEVPLGMKIDKKKGENISEPGSFLTYGSSTEKEAMAGQKKIPMKPTPIRKKHLNQSKQQKQQKNILVIQSKQYMTKNTEQFCEQQPTIQHQIKEREVVEEKPKMKITKARDSMKNKMKVQEQEKEEIKTPLEPFCIKKSVSKKQHVIDYKATQYVSKQELIPLENPKETLKIILISLPKDNDWSKQFESLNSLRRLIKNHIDFYPVISQNMAGIMPQVLKLVESLRSSVAKNAMITLSQMCEALQKSMDPFLQPIFVKLFKKSQDANTFIVDEVRKCMTSLCTYCTTSKICPIILANCNSKAPAVKTKVALCLDKCLEKANYDCQVLKENPKVVGVMSNLIIDGSAEVRTMMKQIFIELLSHNRIVQIEGMFKRSSSKDSWERWKDIMDKEQQLKKC